MEYSDPREEHVGRFDSQIRLALTELRLVRVSDKNDQRRLDAVIERLEALL